MAKLLKWIFWGALSLVVLAGIGIILLLFVVDPNQYKPQIQQVAADNGIQLNISGDLGWQIWPNVAITVGATELSGTGLPDTQFQQVDLVLELGALLGGNVVIDEIAVTQPYIRLDISQANSAEQAAAVAAAPIAAAGAKAPADSGITMNIKALSVSDGTVELVKDGQVQQKIESLQITSRQANLLQQPFPVSASFTIAIPEVARQLAVNLDSTITVDSDFQRFTLSESELALTADTIAYGKHDLAARFDATLDLLADTLLLPGMKIKLDDIPVTLDATVKTLSSAPAIAGKLDIPAFDPNPLLKSISSESGELPVKKLALATTFSSADDNYTLSGLKLSLDDFSLSANASATLKKQREINISAKGNALNLDKYFPASPEEADAQNDNSAALFAPLLAPIALLNGGSGQIEIELTQLVTQGLTLDDLQLAATSTGSIIRVTRYSANGFGGSIKGDAQITLSNKKPLVQLNTETTNVDLHAILSKFAEFEDLKGTGSLSASITAHGDTIEEIEKNISADGSFSAIAPELSGMNIEKSYCDMVALVERREKEQRSWPTVTNFTDTTGTFQIRNRLTNLTNLKSGIGNLRINGKGDADLDAGTYNMLITANLQDERTSETGCEIKSKSIRNRDIPIRCKGNFDGDVSCGPDQAFLQKLLTEKVSEKLLERLFRKKDGADTDEETPEENNPLKKLLENLREKKKNE